MRSCDDGYPSCRYAETTGEWCNGACKTSLGAKNKFKPLQPITHVKTGKKYRILECPKSKKLESTGETFYEYADIVAGQIWIRAKSEMEDGRFV